MRPITRQGTRLAGRNRLSQNRNRRQPFHASLCRASEPRPPNSPPDSTETSSHYRRESLEDANKEEDASEKQQSASANDYAEDRTNSEHRRTSFRKPTRNKRVSEIPKPPPIPQWFLKHNVFLAAEPREPDLAGLDLQVIHCTDATGRETLFKIPYYVRPVEKQSEKVEESKEQSGKPEAEQEGKDGQRKPSEKVEKSEEPSRNPEAKQEGKDGHCTPPEKADANIQQRASSTSMPLTHDFFNHKIDVREHGQSEQDGSTTETVKRHPSSANVDARKTMPAVWNLMEAEASVRAAFAIPEGSNHSSSFAATRVDLSLQCADLESNLKLDYFVKVLAHNVGADLVQLTANDFADLTAEYIGHGRDEPGSFANMAYDVFDGYNLYGTGFGNSQQQPGPEENDEDEYDEDEGDEGDAASRPNGRNMPVATSVVGTLGDLKRLLQGKGGISNQLRGRVVDVGFGASPQVFMPQQSGKSVESTQSQETHRDDAKLTALLDQVVGAAEDKRSSWPTSREEGFTGPTSDSPSVNSLEESWRKLVESQPRKWLPATAMLLVDLLARGFPDNTSYLLKAKSFSAKIPSGGETESRKTIVHIRDLADICNLRLGNDIIDRLVKVVQKRRRTGERIVIVGTTAQDVPGPVAMRGEAAEDQPFRALTVPGRSNHLASRPEEPLTKTKREIYRTMPPLVRSLEPRVREINLRHIQGMLRRLQPGNNVDLFSPTAKAQLHLVSSHTFSEKVMSFDQVQRLILTAIGLSHGLVKSDMVSPLHITLASAIGLAADATTEYSIRAKAIVDREVKKSEASDKKRESTTSETRLQKIKKECNPHEIRLLGGVVDPQNIKTGFNDVHATPETIEALNTLTTLSLLRPDAFKYGVLANDRLSGLLLYGPPGTGKTLLAKAVAKESKATVMEVSGAQIYEKYVGEGEKMVRAVFSLAKRLSPCIVFLDEADAIFGSRSNTASRVTHREIINQFLREWDGMDDHGIFVMVASNRPFDLDDAVLRRLPRRLLVDLPVAKDRESILGIHLRNEQLDPSVSLSKLAEQTPLYSGSDLKNFAVAAALAAVREENSQKQADPDFKLPEKRVLTNEHFEKALAEISASISEDMSTLNAIRKFDERYGDRRGRRKKAGYGFGSSEGAIDEGAARVRHTMVPPTDGGSSTEPRPSAPGGP